MTPVSGAARQAEAQHDLVETLDQLREDLKDRYLASVRVEVEHGAHTEKLYRIEAKFVDFKTGAPQ